MSKNLLFSALLSLVFAVSGHTDAPPAPTPALTITSTLEGEVGDLLYIRVQTTGEIIKWGCPDKRLQMIPSELLNNPKIAIVQSKYPGTYSVFAWTALAGKPTDWVECRVTIVGGVPPTPPSPTPTPPVPPAPAVKKVVLFVVYDPTTLTVPHASLISDNVFWSAIEAKGTPVFTADRNSKEATTKNLNTYVQRAAVGYPALIFAQPDGSFVKAIKLPTGKDGVLSALKEVTGQ